MLVLLADRRLSRATGPLPWLVRTVGTAASIAANMVGDLGGHPAPAPATPTWHTPTAYRCAPCSSSGRGPSRLPFTARPETGRGAHVPSPAAGPEPSAEQAVAGQPEKFGSPVLIDHPN